MVGEATLTVKPPIKATSVAVCPSSVTVNGRSSTQLNAEVYPYNTHDKRIRWSSENCNIADVDPYTGCVCGKSAGTTYIYANAQDGSGVSGRCEVTVRTVNVTGISLNKSSYTFDEVGKFTYLYATVEPSNATNKSVTWSSSDDSVISVNQYGRIASVISNNKSVASAVITATTSDGGFEASCTVTVDTREKVTIEADDEGGYKFFKATFANGLTWESVGVDESLVTGNNYTYAPHYRRAYSNSSKEFSDQQIAFLYRLDPLGVEYYVNNHENGNGTLSALLYKDRIYFAIFGTEDLTNRHFYFQKINGTAVYGNLNNSNNRDQVYSNAEIVFGAHLIPDWSAFWEGVVTTIFGYIPLVNEIELGVKIYKALYYSQSLVEPLKEGASEFIEKYIEAASEMTSSNSTHTLLFGWPRIVFDLLNSCANILTDTFRPENLEDVKIYSGTETNNNYKAIFKASGNNVSLTNIISRCERA